ncbi:hypothetical protein ABTX81_20560 [Kitasatospora sp. NPDC097605]|uniref:hypothetical protein n=1 Tax=Kitasatospora sp. NPDC097605 TaxID=3157226 RepID=UPI00332AFF7C
MAMIRVPDTELERMMRRGLLLVLVLGVLSAACGSSAESVDGQDAPPPVPAAGVSLPAPAESVSPDQGPLFLPVQKYMFSQHEVFEISKAQWVMLNSCLERYSTPPVDFRGSDPAEGDSYRMSRRYGPVVRADVEKRGYHVPDSWTGAKSQDPGAPLTEKQNAVMYGSGSAPKGVPPGGCVGEAARRIAGGGDVVGKSSVAGSINIDSFNLSKSDPRIVAGFTKWSACMKGKGFDYSNPLDAVGDAAWSTPEPSAQEFLVAQADLECKSSTGLTETWVQVESEFQESEIQSRREALEGESRSREAQLKTARDILGGRR